MALPQSRNAREYKCFTEDSQDEVAKRVVAEISQGGNPVSETNPLYATAVLSGDINVDSTSINVEAYIGKPAGFNADFVTARTGNTTFTCATLPTGLTAIKTEDIELIRVISSTGEVKQQYSRDDVVIACAGTDPTTVTVTGATFGTTDTITLYTNVSRPKEVEITQEDDSIVVYGHDGANNQAIKTNSAGEIITAVPTTLAGGTKDVTTAGTAVALVASSTPCKTVHIRAKSGNTGAVYIGGSTVDSTTGISLLAGDSVELDIANLDAVYVDSAEDGEGVGYTFSV